ncbi:hypothetical protein OIU80_05905 [Flavobacterium sp. LS1R47]|uniref:Uncharacterized protein n=1 Tax=Flavobacterium frigoritolerans TaxID=2987686 RepID=A0A9X3C7M8_9FLAO|nr:hypothetical protein [Flavobacterium frigoritolerans]MCV9931812.1 hypothetical protein [Flavobacterium frigoritolerans]
MNRSIAYWIEKLLGYICGLIFMILSYKYNDIFSFALDATFLDKVISISSTLFGFLLAILTLILQGNSPTVTAMKRHGSYNRLINFNKATVISALITCALSLLISFCTSIINLVFPEMLNFLASVNLGIFVSVVVNTLLFTLIFYKIVIADQ